MLTFLIKIYISSHYYQKRYQHEHERFDFTKKDSVYQQVLTKMDDHWINSVQIFVKELCK